MGVTEGKCEPPIWVVVGGMERDLVALKISIGSMMLAIDGARNSDAVDVQRGWT